VRLLNVKLIRVILNPHVNNRVAPDIVHLLACVRNPKDVTSVFNLPYMRPKKTLVNPSWNIYGITPSAP